MKKQIQGIALILFGMLLCLSENGLNHTIFASMSDIPFSLFGVISGIVGLVFVFSKGENENENKGKKLL